jgi:hypothetical protein
MNALSIALGLVAAIGAVMIAAGVRSSGADPAALARQRLARQELGLGQSAFALELEKPLGERLFAPVRRWLTRQMSRVTPATQAANFQRQLEFAGNPFGLDPAGVQTLRVAGAAALGTIGIGLGVLVGSPVALGIFLVIGVGIGFYLPVLWLDQLVRARRAEIEAATWSRSAWKQASAWIEPWSNWSAIKRARSRCLSHEPYGRSSWAVPGPPR